MHVHAHVCGKPAEKESNVKREDSPWRDIRRAGAQFMLFGFVIPGRVCKLWGRTGLEMCLII